MSVSRNNLFYRLLGGITTSFKDQDFEFAHAFNHLKIAVVGGNIEFKLNGPDDTAGLGEGLIKPADGLVQFSGMDAHRISVKEVSGTVSEVRIWAYD